MQEGGQWVKVGWGGGLTPCNIEIHWEVSILTT